MTADASSSALTSGDAVVVAFRRAVEAADGDAVLATLADDITFHNPVMFRPVQGIEGVRLIVPHLLRTWRRLRYTGELRGPGRQVGLIFTAGVGNRTAEGIDLLHLDERGRIDRITVMVRPLSALQTLADEMAEALRAGR